MPVKTVAEFIANAKTNPGKIGVASAGIGTSLHLFSRAVQNADRGRTEHVPYRGGVPALTDLVAGQVPAMFDNLSTSLEHIKTGKLRLLGVGSPARLQMLPDVPTIAETVPGYEASSVFGVGVPTGTPAEIIEKLNGEFNAALVNPHILSAAHRANPYSDARDRGRVQFANDRYNRKVGQGHQLLWCIGGLGRALTTRGTIVSRSTESACRFASAMPRKLT